MSFLKNQLRKERKMITSKKNGFRGNYQRTTMLVAVIIGVIMLLWTLGCSSGPDESPEVLVKSFLKKHLLMTDLSLAAYYASNEQSFIKDRINRSIESKKKEGVLDSANNANYDLSNVIIKVIDKKDEYVNDEDVMFAKVRAKGDYTVTQNGKTQKFIEDETFILRVDGDTWKVTEKINPWN